MFRKLIFPLITVGFFFMLACKKDTPLTDPGAKLEFSTDTILFDTVFTKLGNTTGPRSVNKRFTLRNPHNKPIRTGIFLAGGQASPFRINIDGNPSLAVSNYELRAHDSAYVFVEVTLDQNNQNNPLIIQDSIVFVTNGNKQDIKLVAWGQDAHYFDEEVLPCNTTWTADKPYVIYNSVLVPEGCNLTIGPGVRIHSSVNSRLYVQGTLKIEGQKGQEVIIQGARLGHAYKDVASEWWGIHLLPSSKNNRISYAEIKNGVVGVEVDSLQPGGGTKLSIDHSIIKNMSAGGLICYTATVDASNLVVANCGQYTFLGALGGDYNLRHCTFANYNTTFTRTKASFGLDDSRYQGITNMLNCTLYNSIVYGSLKEELIFADNAEDPNNFTLDIRNSIFKTEITGLDVNNNLVNVDPRFKNFKENNFELDTLSPAKDAGMQLVPAIIDDVRGIPRDAFPDIGAYEKQ